MFVKCILRWVSAQNEPFSLTKTAHFFVLQDKSVLHADSRGVERAVHHTHDLVEGGTALRDIVFDRAGAAAFGEKRPQRIGKRLADVDHAHAGQTLFERRTVHGVMRAAHDESVDILAVKRFHVPRADRLRDDIVRRDAVFHERHEKRAGTGDDAHARVYGADARFVCSAFHRRLRADDADRARFRHACRELCGAFDHAADRQIEFLAQRAERVGAHRAAGDDDHLHVLAEQEALADTLVDSMLGFGPLEPFLADESITEIMVNGSRSLFYEREGVLHRSEFCFASDDEVRMLIDRIIGPLGRRIDESSPMVNARLAQGHRVNAIVPPLALDGPMLTIRTFSSRVITLQDMVESGSVEWSVQRLLIWAVRARKSIAVSGGTGSGKTTLLNALSCHVPPDERIITIEDSAELRFLEHPHVVRLEARPRNAEGVGEVTIRDLVANALRMRPDRIIVGECRGGEALDMLSAMNTGHEGSLTTLHANSPKEAISRLVTMVRFVADLPVDAIESQIASAFDLIVQTARGADGSRMVSQIAVISPGESIRECIVAPIYQRDICGGAGMWLSAPEWVGDLVKLGIATDKEVQSWKEMSLCAS